MSAIIINPYTVDSFQPKDISGLEIWLDASDSATLFDASSGGSLPANNVDIRRWEDKSGNNRHFTKSSGGVPNRQTSVVNSRDAVRFRGVSETLIRTNGTLSASNMKNLFFVSRTSDTQYVFLASSSTNGAYFDATQNNTGNPLGGDGGTVDTYRVNGVNISKTRAALLTARGSTTNILSLIGMNLSNVASWTNIEFNYRWGSFDVSDGYACELLIYSSIFSTTNRDRIERYLANKWGVTI